MEDGVDIFKGVTGLAQTLQLNKAMHFGTPESMLSYMCVPIAYCVGSLLSV